MIYVHTIQFFIIGLLKIHYNYVRPFYFTYLIEKKKPKEKNDENFYKQFFGTTKEEEQEM